MRASVRAGERPHQLPTISEIKQRILKERGAGGAPGGTQNEESLQPWFTCSICSIPRGIQDRPANFDIQQPVCKYCFNLTVDDNLATEYRWCVFGSHRVLRAQCIIDGHESNCCRFCHLRHGLAQKFNSGTPGQTPIPSPFGTPIGTPPFVGSPFGIMPHIPSGALGSHLPTLSPSQHSPSQTDSPGKQEGSPGYNPGSQPHADKLPDEPYYFSGGNELDFGTCHGTKPPWQTVT